MRKYIPIILVSILGCASMNQALTPSAKTTINKFDGAVEVIQKPVSSACSPTEARHTLGFRWLSSLPYNVFIKVGVPGTINISILGFNIDGEIVYLSTAGKLTNYGNQSTRQFSMPLEKFRKMANAQVVIMKVVMIEERSISSFGQSKPRAIVSGKFAPFLEQVDVQLSK